jgi:hydroxymethylbilane synthase
MIPAPAQGAIGIECRADDAMTAELLNAIDDSETHQAILAERAFTLALGGTCHSPVAAHARVEGDDIALACELLSEDGRDYLADAIRFPIGDLEAPANLARRMLAEAPRSIRNLFESR